jgi:glucokinase
MEEMPVIAIDFGGTTIKLGIVKQGKVTASRAIPAKSHEGIRSRLNPVVIEVKKMLDEQGLSLNHCRCVGIAIPGLVNFGEKRVISIPPTKYGDALTVDFTKWSEKEFDLPIVMDTDTNCAILGETAYGCARGASDAILMSFGTGVGTAAMMNGHLVRGKHYQAGCLGGHLIIDYNSRACFCGNRGCLEAMASTSTLPDVAKEREGFAGSLLAKQAVINYKAVTDCADAGDEFSRDLLAYLLQCWGAGIVNMIHAYDPEVIILSGGLMNERGKILPALEQYAVKNAWLSWGTPVFRVPENPDDSVLLGLHALCEYKG